MKLAMRARSNYKKVTLFTAAFVLALSSLTASVPFILAKNAAAAPGIVTSSTGFNTLTGWATDRAPVSGQKTVTNDEIVFGVDGDNPDSKASNAFYKTEGENAALPTNVQSIKASLYLDPAWATTDSVRAGIWGVTADPSYPILEFSNRNDGAGVLSQPRFQVWATGPGWLQTSVPVNYGSTYTFEIFHNKYTNKYEYYINDAVVAEAPAGTAPLTRIIFNNFNAGIAGNDYDVRWTNFQVGYQELQAPVATYPNTHFFTTSSFPVTQTWTAVQGAVNYKYESYKGVNPAVDPSATPILTKTTTDTFRNVGSVNTPPSQGEGVYYWRVKAVDAQGNESAWSNVAQFTLDTQAPVLSASAPVNGSTISTADNKIKLVGSISDNIAANYAHAQIVDNGGNSRGITTIYGAKNNQVLTEFDATGLEDGTYTIYYWGADLAGNVSEKKSVTFTLDNTDPVIQFAAGTPADGAHIRGTVAMNAIISDANVGPYNLRIENPAPNPLSLGLHYVYAPVSGATNNYSWNTLSGPKAVSDGVHNVYATTVDKAGNRSTVTKVVTVDNTKPVVSITTPSQTIYKSSESLVVNATDAISLDKVVANIYKAGQTSVFKSTQATVPGNATSYAHTVSLASLADGDYYLKFNATDLAGNLAQTITFNFTVDNTAPVVVSLTHSNDNDDTLVNTDVTSTLTFNEAVQTPAGWTEVEGSGKKQFTKVSTANNKGTLTFADLVGNTGSVFFEVKRIDKVEPVLNIAPGSIFIGGSVSVIAKEDNIKEIRVNGVAVPFSNTKPNYTAIVSGNGTYTIVATDKAGNSATTNFVIDDSIIVTLSSFDLTVENPEITGNAVYVRENNTPAMNIPLRITVNGTQYDVETDQDGNFSQQIAVVDGEYTIKIDRVGGTEEDVTLTEVFNQSFTTTLPEEEETDNGGETGGNGGSNNGGSNNGGTAGGNTNGGPIALNTQNGTPAPLNNGAGTQGVLGDSTDNTDTNETGTPEVEGASTQNTIAQTANTDGDAGRLFGLAWYWWLLILAGATLLAWWIIAAIRRRNAEEN